MIFCDSQKALKVIAFSTTHQKNRFLRSHIYQKTEDLQRNGHLITFQ